MIRRAIISDFEHILNIERQSFTGDLLSRRALLYHFKNNQASILVDEDNGIIRGYALIFHHTRARLCRLYSLAVDPNHRGKRIGEALLREIETVCGKSGCKLEIREDNDTAKHLYESGGYHLRRLRKGYYEDGATALEMVKNF
jgi:ribosomal protein S18 acetylase RimI-like enzyme